MVKIKLFSIVFLALAFIALLGFTSPNNAPLMLYVAVFFCMYLFFLVTISLLMDAAYSGFTSKLKFFISSVAAFSPTVIVALTSLSNISIIDVVFAITIPAVIIWYGLRNNTVK